MQPTTMREAFSQSKNQTVVGFLTQKKAREDEMRRRANVAHAKMMRDKAIMEIHRLSYSRKSSDGGGMLVPRKKEWRGKLNAAIQKAAVYAALARPENGYPPPPYRRDPEYPNGALLHAPRGRLDITNLVAERNRLVFWRQVLEMREAPMEMMRKVEAHIVRLNRRIDRGMTNDMIRRRPGTKEYTMRPAPRTIMKVVVEYKS